MAEKICLVAFDDPTPADLENCADTATPVNITGVGTYTPENPCPIDGRCKIDFDLTGYTQTGESRVDHKFKYWIKAGNAWQTTPSTLTHRTYNLAQWNVENPITWKHLPFGIIILILQQ